MTKEERQRKSEELKVQRKEMGIGEEKAKAEADKG